MPRGRSEARGVLLDICIDITGFMRPHILYFLKYLKGAGVKQVDMIYTEPEHYSRKAETTFSIDDVAKVRSVFGYEGQHSHGMEGDVLIVGVGYDHGLMSRVILEKESARLIQLHCFPSLSADMYHESILRLDRVASASKGRDHEHVLFSSANDPYVTAAELSRAYWRLKRAGLTNLYLSPLATKPHTLGFGSFYLKELEGTASSLIFLFRRDILVRPVRVWVAHGFIRSFFEAHLKLFLAAPEEFSRVMAG